MLLYASSAPHARSKSCVAMRWVVFHLLPHISVLELAAGLTGSGNDMWNGRQWQAELLGEMRLLSLFLNDLFLETKALIVSFYFILIGHMPLSNFNIFRKEKKKNLKPPPSFSSSATSRTHQPMFSQLDSTTGF